MSKPQPKIISLMGPTAVGKTKIAFELAKRLPVEIISVDSAMVYRSMDIGTAKPSHDELQKVPHHLINICDPQEHYSAGKFHQDASQKIASILAKEKIPLLVGGTMLYFKVLQQGISYLPTANPKIRAELQIAKERLGIEYLYQRLQKVDPVSATQIKPQDFQRIQRALEIYQITGRTMSELKQRFPPRRLNYEWNNLVIVPKSTELLKKKIFLRFKQMLELGLIDEVAALYQRKELHSELPSMRSVGYRQVWQYLAKEISYEELLKLVPVATGQLAKRQLTWLKNWQPAIWLDSGQPKTVDNILQLLDG